MKIGIAKEFDDLCIKKESKREYVGASIIGKECDRQIWYDYYRDNEIEPRVQRIFDLGRMIEMYVVATLKKKFKVYDEDSNGEQFGFKDDIIAGHCDGVIVGLPESSEPHILEIKSANSKRFKEFQEKGVKECDRTYYVQCLVYMLYLKLNRCLFVVYNKDNSEMSFERIEADNETAKKFVDRAKLIFEFDKPPERKYKDKTFFKCKFCNHADECWK